MIVKWLIFKNVDEFNYLSESKPYKVLDERSISVQRYVVGIYEIEDDDGNTMIVRKEGSIYDYDVLYKHHVNLKDFVAPDNVTNPSHYINGNIETIDYLKDTLSKEQYEGFCRGNVLKYLSRYPHKNGVEDLNKAKTYLEWLIESVEE